MKKAIALVLVASLFSCKKNKNTPEPDPLPIKTLYKQKVNILFQNGCTTYSVDMKLSYAGKDTIVNSKSFFSFFEDSIKAEKIIIEPRGTSCMTRTITINVNNNPAITYTSMISAITHTLQ